MNRIKNLKYIYGKALDKLHAHVDVGAAVIWAFLAGMELNKGFESNALIPLIALVFVHLCLWAEKYESRFAWGLVESYKALCDDCFKQLDIKISILKRTNNNKKKAN